MSAAKDMIIANLKGQVRRLREREKNLTLEGLGLIGKVEALEALVEAQKKLLADYEREAEAPTICEGATE